MERQSVIEAFEELNKWVKERAQQHIDGMQGTVTYNDLSLLLIDTIFLLRQKVSK
jgi:hypothetical protein